MTGPCSFRRTARKMIQRSLLYSADYLITSKIMLNVEKFRGSVESDLLSVMQTSIITATLQVSGDNNMLFSDRLLFAGPSLCSSPPVSSLRCAEKNVVEAGVYLKMYTYLSTVSAAVFLKMRA